MQRFFVEIWKGEHASIKELGASWGQCVRTLNRKRDVKN